MDGKAYLEELIAAQLSAKGFMLHHMEGVAHGLVAAGALEQPEARRILADLRETLLRQGKLQIRTASVKQESSFGARSVTGRPRPEWVRATEQPPPPEPLSVLPVLGQRLRVNEVAVEFLSLELWTTMLRLTYTYRGERIRDLHWKAWDDTGSRYIHSGGSGGGAGWYAGSAQFRPAPPSQARTFTVASEADEVTFELR